MNGSPIYYEGNATGSFVLVETVVDTTSGPASECTRLRRPGARNVMVTNRYRDLHGLLHRHAAPNITSPSTFNKRSIARGTTSVFTVTGSDFQSGVTAWIDDSDYTVNSVTFVDSPYQAEPPHGSQSPLLVRAGFTPSNGCRKLPLSGGADLPGRDQDLLDW